jgi:hypothetical protein
MYVLETGIGHDGLGEDRMVVKLGYSEQLRTQLAFAVAFPGLNISLGKRDKCF